MAGVDDEPAGEPEDEGAYCRAVEAHLCRRNAGHLVRIVGPSFELVSGWAARGVPLRVALRGIDRAVDRRAAKGPQRRPLRIEHCEADVLDVFDEWRRAVGAPARGDDGEDAAPSRRAEPLAAHVARVVARLTALQGQPGVPAALRDAAAAIARELDAAGFAARGLRGEARSRFLERLGQLDAELLRTARAQLDAATVGRLTRQAEHELEPYRSRMTSEAHAAAVDALVSRLVRDQSRLPFVAQE